MAQLNTIPAGVNQSLTTQLDENFELLSDAITSVQNITSTLSSDISTELSAHSQTASSLVSSSSASVVLIPTDNSATSSKFNNNFTNLVAGIKQEDQRTDTLLSDINNSTVRNAHNLVTVDTTGKYDHTTLSANTYSAGLDTNLKEKLNSDFTSVFDGLNKTSRNLGQTLHYTEQARSGHSSSLTTHSNLKVTSGSLTEDTSKKATHSWSELLPTDFSSLIGIEENNNTTTTTRTVVYSTGSSIVIGTLDLSDLSYSRGVEIPNANIPSSSEVTTSTYDDVKFESPWKGFIIDSDNYVIIRTAIRRDTSNSDVGQVVAQAAHYDGTGALTNKGVKVVEDFSSWSQIEYNAETMSSSLIPGRVDGTTAILYIAFGAEYDINEVFWMHTGYITYDTSLGSLGTGAVDGTRTAKTTYGGTTVSIQYTVDNGVFYVMTFGRVDDGDNDSNDSVELELRYVKWDGTNRTDIQDIDVDGVDANWHFGRHLNIFWWQLEGRESLDLSVSDERYHYIYHKDTNIASYDDTSDAEEDEFTHEQRYLTEGLEIQLRTSWINPSGERNDKKRIFVDGSNSNFTNWSELYNSNPIKHWFLDENGNVQAFDFSSGLVTYYTGSWRYKKPVTLPTNSEVFVYGLPTLSPSFSQNLSNLRGYLSIDGTEYGPDEWVRTPSSIGTANYIIELEDGVFDNSTTALYVLQNTS